MAHVFVARAQQLPTYLHPQLLACLSPEERARWARMCDRETATQFLLAHALKRHVLAPWCDAAPAELTFRATALGRPELAATWASTDVRFSVAYSGGVAVCAVTRAAAIGVDVEDTTRPIALRAFSEAVFSEPERRSLAALTGAAQRRRLFALWTLKEAYFKARGTGLASALHKVSFAAELPDPVAVTCDGPPDLWCCRRRWLAPDHCVAVAAAIGVHAPVYFHDVAPALFF